MKKIGRPKKGEEMPKGPYKRPKGRPVKKVAPGYKACKLNDRIQKKIFDLIKIGVRPNIAATSVGISSVTLNNWLKRGIEAKNKIDAGQKVDPNEIKYANLAALFDKARSIAEVHDVKRLEKAIKRRDTIALRWKMERSYPENWGEKRQYEHKHEHSGPNGEAIPIEFVSPASLSLEFKKKIVEEAERLQLENKTSSAPQVFIIDDVEIEEKHEKVSA